MIDWGTKYDKARDDARNDRMSMTQWEDFSGTLYAEINEAADMRDHVRTIYAIKTRVHDHHHS